MSFESLKINISDWSTIYGKIGSSFAK